MAELAEMVRFKLPLARKRLLLMDSVQRAELWEQIERSLFGAEGQPNAEGCDRSTELSYLIVLLGG